MSYVEQDQWLRNGLWLEGCLYERPGGVNHEDLFTALRQEFDDDSVSLVIADSQKLFEKDWIVAEFHFLVWLDAPKELSWQRRIHKRWKGRKWIHECKRNYFYVHVWPHHIAVYKQSVFKHFGRRIDLNIPAEDSINSFTRTGGRENPCDAAARAGSARPIDDAVAEAAAAIGEEASIGFSDLRRAAIAGTSSGGRQRRQRPKLQQQKQHTRGTDAEAQTAAAAEVGPAAVMHCEPLQLKLGTTASAARAAASSPHARNMAWLPLIDVYYDYKDMCWSVPHMPATSGRTRSTQRIASVTVEARARKVLCGKTERRPQSTGTNL